MSCCEKNPKTIALNLKSSTLPLCQIKSCIAGMIREFGSYHKVILPRAFTACICISDKRSTKRTHKTLVDS